jgi:hypothetical protein
MRWLVVLLLLAACYNHNTPVKPCTNIANCDDPTAPPPIHDSKAPDGGR